MNGFPRKFIDMSMTVVTSGKVEKKIKWRNWTLFLSLSRAIAVDVLAIVIQRAQNERLLCGLATNITTRGMSTLQYANDTIMLFENDFEQARNLKIITVCAF
jgi:DUF1009 family protein